MTNDPFAVDVIGPQVRTPVNQLHFGFTDEDGVRHPDMDIGSANVDAFGEDDADSPEADRGDEPNLL